jgi:hypothetical protein
LAPVGLAAQKRQEHGGRKFGRLVREDQRSGSETLSSPPVGGFKAARL